MKTKQAILGALLGLLILGAAAAPVSAGVYVYASDGRYFRAEGPAQYWHYDYNEGYCGKFGKWCSPASFRWTYSMDPLHSTNYAVWKIEPAQQYFSRAYAFIPCKDATALAFYGIGYAGASVYKSRINQLSFCNQWVQLNSGALYLIGSVDLSDNNEWFGASGRYRVAFDEIKIEN